MNDELPADILQALVAAQNDRAEQSVAFILRDWLIGHGYLPAPPDDPEGTN